MEAGDSAAAGGLCAAACHSLQGAASGDLASIVVGLVVGLILRFGPACVEALRAARRKPPAPPVD